ncbi:hypothetical protein [Exiguobacterium chiriqhucha]|uniref:hypothetical protein n=1 Tax=Exiguobacterium chiriqhucha TaxID=1385984 RepID=UPI0011873CC5|nr:hypothetical protein [Exiguobacterium chiriqhucha]
MDHRDPPFSELGDFKQWGRFDINVPLQGGQAELQAAVSIVRHHIPLRLGGFYIIASEDGIFAKRLSRCQFAKTYHSPAPTSSNGPCGR